MTAVAVAIQVYDITKSSFAVGIVGMAQLLPLVVLGLFGGAMSDSYDRRTIGFVSSVGMAGSSVLLLIQAVQDNQQVWIMRHQRSLNFKYKNYQKWNIFVPQLNYQLYQLVK